MLGLADQLTKCGSTIDAGRVPFKGALQYQESIQYFPESIGVDFRMPPLVRAIFCQIGEFLHSFDISALLSSERDLEGQVRKTLSETLRWKKGTKIPDWQT